MQAAADEADPVQVIADFEAAAAAATTLLRDLSASHLAWRPHPRSRSIGELAAHLIHLLGYAPNLATTSGHDLAKATSTADPPYFSPPDLFQRFQNTTASTSSLLSSLRPTDLEAPWTLSRAGHPIVTLPRRVALQVFLTNHLRHHTAQLELSLRLAGLPC